MNSNDFVYARNYINNIYLFRNDEVRTLMKMLGVYCLSQKNNSAIYKQSNYNSMFRQGTPKNP